jgi:hypothetical protein
MDGQFKSLTTGDSQCVIRDLALRYKEDCQLRLARIQNGAHPDFQNGAKPKKGKKKGY